MRTGTSIARAFQVALGLTLIGAQLSGAAAQTISNSARQIGGPGGGGFDDACRTNDVLIGFNYQAGKALNTIAPVCQAQNNGTLVGANYGLHTHGHNETNGSYGSVGLVRCPPGQAISAIHVWVDAHAEVHSVRATCSPMIATAGQGTYLRSTDNTGGQAFSDGSASCPGLKIAVGMTGASGALIDRLGLKCELFAWR